MLEVIEQGITAERNEEPEHAKQLTRWKYSLPAKGFTFVLPSAEIMDIAIAMMSTRSLKNLWLTSPNAKREKLPHEIYVAATSLACRMKIVTLGTKRYQSIVDAGFPLPGFITPECQVWGYGGSAQATTQRRHHGIALH